MRSIRTQIIESATRGIRNRLFWLPSRVVFEATLASPWPPPPNVASCMSLLLAHCVAPIAFYETITRIALIAIAV